MAIKVYNPGSEEAIRRGCVCPIIDNNYGHSAPYPNNGWIYSGDCPILSLHPSGDDDTG